MFRGLRASLLRSLEGLARGDRTHAALGMDESLRAAEAGTHSAPGAFYGSLQQIEAARLALQQGNQRKAARQLLGALQVLRPAEDTRPVLLEANRYRGAKVINPKGAIIGEVVGTSDGALDLALGGWRDAWGFLDFSLERRVSVPTDALAFGPPRRIGTKLVMVPTEAVAESAQHRAECCQGTMLASLHVGGRK